MPDSGQEHTLDGDDGFLVTTVGFDTAVTFCNLRMFLRFDQSICNLHQNWFKIGTSTGNPSGLDLEIALIVTGITSCPGNKMLVCKEHRHVAANIRENLNRRKRFLSKPGTVRIRLRTSRYGSETRRISRSISSLCFFGSSM